MGMFGLKVGDFSLTRNEDVWSQTIRDTVLVSAYPLAAWMVSSWWRLLYEPLPPTGTRPSVSWRMAHDAVSNASPGPTPSLPADMASTLAS